MPPFSVLDLAPIAEGSTAGDALRNARRLARQVERLGYQRFWLAEHHNMIGIASAATAVAIGYVADSAAAEGVVAAAREVSLHVPLVVRLEGTNVDKGKQIINESDLNVIAADDLDDAAQKIVKAVEG